MNHFYIDPEALKREETQITGEDARHLIKSLRVKPGEIIELLDGEDNRATGTITQIGKDCVSVKITEYQRAEKENQRVKITLYQGVPKGSKLKQIVEKSTELGVGEITPFYSSRSVSRPSSSDKKKTQKLNETAHQASKQCGRGKIPQVNPFIDFDTLVENLDKHDVVVVAYEDELNKSLKSVLKSFTQPGLIDLALIIGPEGGFDTSEIEDFKKIGSHIVSLGPRILRTETAGIAGIAQINYEFES